MSAGSHPLHLEPGAGPGGAAKTLRNGNPRGNPNSAPRCGARARTTGCPCRAPAMRNGRCRMHGGKCTGPRTAEGMARMIAANTTHGRYGAASAAERTQQRHVRTVVRRSKLMCAATRLLPYLPAEMAARLEAYPADLRAPKHPSQVAFEAACAAKPCNSGGEVLAPRMRAAERAAIAAEVASQAPWRAAIAYARAARRATWERTRAAKRARETGRASDAAILREMAFRMAGLRTVARSQGAVCEVDPGIAAGTTSPAAPAARESDGLGEAGRDALQPETTELAPRRLSPTMALALSSTTAGRTWEVAELRAQLATLFGPGAPQALSDEGAEVVVFGGGPHLCPAP